MTYAQSTATAPDVDTDEPSLTDRFLAFHKANPHVYGVLRDLARQWRTSGKTKCSITLLYNMARWQLNIRTTSDDELFELNDHYQAFYARALMHFEADLVGTFNLRRAPEADAWIATFQFPRPAEGPVAA